MAGTDNLTASDSPLEWLLIIPAIELVARYMPQGAAKELLLIELDAKRIRYRFHGKTKDSGWVFPLTYFWLRDDKSIEHEITADSTVIRRGIVLVKADPPPPMRRRRGYIRRTPDERDTERYVFDPGRRTTVTRLTLVRLHRGDILHRLQETGFLPMQQELPLSAPTMPPVAKECSAWDPQSEWSVERALQELGISGRQQKVIAAKVPELSKLRRYRDKSIVEILDNISAAELQRAVGLKSPDSCEKFLRAWKAYRAKQRG